MRYGVPFLGTKDDLIGEGHYTHPQDHSGGHGGAVTGRLTSSATYAWDHALGILCFPLPTHLTADPPCQGPNRAGGLFIHISKAISSLDIVAH